MVLEISKKVNMFLLYSARFQEMLDVFAFSRKISLHRKSTILIKQLQFKSEVIYFLSLRGRFLRKSWLKNNTPVIIFKTQLKRVNAYA